MAAPRTLRPETALAMRVEAAAGESAAALARRYGVGCTTAERILRGDTYRDVGGPLVPPQTRPEPLPDATIVAIRSRRALGEGVADIAAAFGITRQMCDRIVRGVTYTTSGGPITPNGGQSQKVPQITALAAAVIVKRERAFSIEGMAAIMGVSRNAAEKRIDRMFDLEYFRRSPRHPALFEITADGWEFIASLVTDD